MSPLKYLHRFLEFLGLRRREPRVTVPAGIRARFDACMASAERKLGRKWKGRILRVVTRPGTKKQGRYWLGPLPGSPSVLCGAFCAGTRHLADHHPLRGTGRDGDRPGA